VQCSINNTTLRLSTAGEQRLLYLGTQLYMCFVSQDGSYAKWFTGFRKCMTTITPQLREVNISAGRNLHTTANGKETPVKYNGNWKSKYMYVKNSDLKIVGQ